MSPPLIQVKPVELAGVPSHDLPLLGLADVLEVTCDNVARMRPGGGSVGVIGGPHDVVYPNPLPAGDPKGVIDEGAIHLTPKVFAGLQGQLRRPWRRSARWTEACKGSVHALQVVGQPAAVVLCRYELQAREPFQHAGEDEDAEGLLDFVGGNGSAHGPLFSPVFPWNALHASDGVQTDGHVQLLCRGPERIVER